jgi:hypothetical protein
MDREVGDAEVVVVIATALVMSRLVVQAADYLGSRKPFLLNQ